MRFDGKKPIEFTDETVELEQANLEETKYVLKGSAPSTDSSLEEPTEPTEPTGDPDLDFGDDGGEDLDLGGEEGGAEKPFDDEPFDAGVEADEDTDPEKYIQQLSGKLGQSLRQHSDDTGEPDFDLEKFAVNSVLSATHTGEMDGQDQKDIIKKVKGSGTDDGMGDEPTDGMGDEPTDEPTDDMGDKELDFGEEGMEETVNWANSPEESYHDAEMTEDNIDELDSMFGKDKRWSESYLRESEKNGIFVDRNKVIKDLRLMETEEPTIAPQPITKPSVKPAKPLRETDRPFSPKRRTHVQPDPKAESTEIINDEEDK